MLKKIIFVFILLCAGNVYAACEDQLIGLGVPVEKAVAICNPTGTLAAEDITTSDDLTVGDDLTVTDDATVTGNATLTSLATATAGIKFSASIFETKAAAGDGSQGQATALTAAKFFHQITASDETKAVALPACAAANIGEVHFLLNTVANKFLKIYPATGGNINGLGANNAFSAGATGQGGKTTTCACQAANVWYCG